MLQKSMTFIYTYIHIYIRMFILLSRNIKPQVKQILILNICRQGFVGRFSNLLLCFLFYVLCSTKYFIDGFYSVT